LLFYTVGFEYLPAGQALKIFGEGGDFQFESTEEIPGCRAFLVDH
jgi:hypothetical protein